jgi:sec-independent protein translocase protein TatB
VFGSVGVFEMLVIAAVALMVLGPEKFPEFAKMAARFVKDIRSYANEIQREVAKEIKPMTKELEDLRRIDPEKYLDKLASDDEEDEKLKSSPPNPEPHPSEMGFGPAGQDAAPPRAPDTTEPPGPSPVAYGEGVGDPYPREPDPPAGPDSPAVEGHER